MVLHIRVGGTPHRLFGQPDERLLKKGRDDEDVDFDVSPTANTFSTTIRLAYCAEERDVRL